MFILPYIYNIFIICSYIKFNTGHSISDQLIAFFTQELEAGSDVEGVAGAVWDIVEAESCRVDGHDDM